jgi:uncharacterized protein
MQVIVTTTCRWYQARMSAGPAPRATTKALHVAVVTLALFAAPVACAASFDCTKARTADEKAVCSDSQLSDLDVVANRAFAAAIKAADPGDRSKVRSVARDAMSERHKCGSDRVCIVDSYLGSFGYYLQSGAEISLPPWLTAPLLARGPTPKGGRLPAAVGECTTTAVKEVGPRLEGGDGSDGTSVTFENGGYQVSYEREPKLVASRAGDKVVMCLATIPRFCPAADHRGKLYLVTNTRTGETWWLPDSEHGCGGA